MQPGFPMGCSGHLLPSLRVWNRRDIKRELFVQAGCNQVHLWTFPYPGDFLEYLRRKGPLLTGSGSSWRGRLQ